eukprot:scaffold9428_cov200-Ochromonas_danica.AAC.4
MSSERSLLWQLDRDVLHCLYSEWLGSWRDLRALDVACAGESGGDRAAWLSSLSGLVMARGMNELPDYFRNKVVELYKWLGSRNVFLVEDFPVRLESLDDLQNALNLTTYCPDIRSIEIDRNEGTDDSRKEVNIKAMQDGFCLFLKQCRRLNSVTIKPHGSSFATIKIDEMLLSVMFKELKNNTLVKINLRIDSVSISLRSITRLLSNHTSSIKDVVIVASVPIQGSFDEVLNFLGQNRISLRRLTIGSDLLSRQRLLDYVSTFGTSIEILELGGKYYHEIDLAITEEVLLSIGRACPRLRTLRLSTKDRRFSGPTMVRLSELYRICPDLRALSFPSIEIDLVVDDKKHEVLFSNNKCRSREETEDWIECVRTVVDRCGYKYLTMMSYSDKIVNGDHWDVVKSKLSPYITTMEVSMIEATLVEAVRDLPRLEKLDVCAGNFQIGDVSLAAVVEHASARLQMLHINAFYPSDEHFTDQMISKMIRACQRLQVLIIRNAGCESVLAVKDHGCLREVFLNNVAAEESVIASVLQEEGENQHWPRTLRRGVVERRNAYSFFYEAKSHTWYLADDRPADVIGGKLSY